MTMNKSQAIDRRLCADLLRTNFFQPATAVWRAAELGHVLRHGLPEGRGLDLGCGDGRLTALVLERLGPRRLVGIDLDPAETKAAAATGIYERVHTGPAAAIAEPDASVDFVFSNSVLEHIPDLDPVLAEVARLLRPGGRFIFTVPGPDFHACLGGPWMPGVTRPDYLAALDRRLAHRRYPTATDWRGLLNRHGLTLDGVEGYLSRAEVRRWELLSRLTAGLLHTLTGGRAAPITIQRRLGLRQIQNRAALPAALAVPLAHLVTLGLRADDGAGPAGCLLLAGGRR